MTVLLSLICLHSFTLKNSSCPLALKLLPYDEIEVSVPSYTPVSFANWKKNVYIEVSMEDGGDKKYGPYTNKRKVFGIYFGKIKSTILITNDKSTSTKIVLGCNPKQNQSNFYFPNGFKHVGNYSQDYEETIYPILFTDDQSLSKYFLKLDIPIICISFLASFILMCYSGKCYDLF